MANRVFLAFASLILVAKQIQCSTVVDELYYVTEFEGRRFYEQYQKRTQEGAKEFCESIGLELATLETQEVLNKLQHNLQSTDAYWTGGVSVATIEKFHWDLGNEQNRVEMDVKNITEYSGIFYSPLGGTNYLATARQSAFSRPLCQSVLPTCQT